MKSASRAALQISQKPTDQTRKQNHAQDDNVYPEIKGPERII
jgi:hypothetical protein